MNIKKYSPVPKTIRNKKNVAYTAYLSVSLICLIIIINNFNFSYGVIYNTLLLIRQVLGFIFIVYIPGNLFLKLLNINNTDFFDKIVYSIGISLSITMIIGFFVNILYPLIGISKPISLWPLVLTFCVINLILSVFIDYKDKNELAVALKGNAFNKIDYGSCLYISLLPILTVIGTTYASSNHNYILICLLFMIALVPIMIVTNRVIKEEYYPLSIYMIALSLLLHVSLVSQYPMRINTDMEYLYQQLVIQNNIWSSNIAVSTNTALSVVLIAPVITQITDTSLFWMLRCGYQILFSFVPLILYQLYSKQFDKKTSFLSVCFFMFYLYFYFEGTLLRRQQIALIYFSLILLLIVNKDINLLQKKILMVIFTYSIIVSHYSVSMMFLLLLLIIYGSSILIKILKLDKLKYRINSDHSNFSKTYLFIFLSFLISWFLFVGAGEIFSTITMLGRDIYLDFFLQSGKSIYISQAFGAGFFDVSAHGKIYRLLQYLSQLFVIVGSVNSIRKPSKIDIDYMKFIVAALVLLFITLVTPYMSTKINIFRIYFMLLLILSPFCILGAENLYLICCKNINAVCNNMLHSKVNSACIKGRTISFKIIFVVFFLVPYFLYNSGFVFEVADFDKQDSNVVRIPVSPSLSYDSNSGYYTEQEIIAAKKISNILDGNIPLYSDMWIGYDLISAWNNNSKIVFSKTDLETSPHYIFLRRGNIYTKKFNVYGDLNEFIELNISELNNENKIYNNGDASVLGIFSIL